MALFHFRVATEANNYEIDTKDEVWVKNDKGELTLLEDDTNENNKE